MKHYIDKDTGRSTQEIYDRAVKRTIDACGECCTEWFDEEFAEYIEMNLDDNGKLNWEEFEKDIMQTSDFEIAVVNNKEEE